jgi:hypothetical protein
MRVQTPTVLSRGLVVASPANLVFPQFCVRRPHAFEIAREPHRPATTSLARLGRGPSCPRRPSSPACWRDPSVESYVWLAASWTTVCDLGGRPRQQTDAPRSGAAVPDLARVAPGSRRVMQRVGRHSVAAAGRRRRRCPLPLLVTGSSRLSTSILDSHLGDMAHHDGLLQR